MAQRGMGTGIENNEHTAGYGGGSRKVRSAKFADHNTTGNGVIGMPGNSPPLKEAVHHEASMTEKSARGRCTVQNLHDGYEKQKMPPASGSGSPDTDYFRGEDREDY